MAGRWNLIYFPSLLQKRRNFGRKKSTRRPLGISGLEAEGGGGRTREKKPRVPTSVAARASGLPSSRWATIGQLGQRSS